MLLARLSLKRWMGGRCTSTIASRARNTITSTQNRAAVRLVTSRHISCCPAARLWQFGTEKEQAIFGCTALSNIDSRGLVRFYGNHNGIVFKDYRRFPAACSSSGRQFVTVLKRGNVVFHLSIDIKRRSTAKNAEARCSATWTRHLEYSLGYHGFIRENET